MVVAMVVAMAVATATAMEVEVAMAVAVAMAVVNFKECKNDLDDSWIHFSRVVHGLPVAGSAIRLLSLRAG